MSIKYVDLREGDQFWAKMTVETVYTELQSSSPRLAITCDYVDPNENYLSDINGTIYPEDIEHLDIIPLTKAQRNSAINGEIKELEHQLKAAKAKLIK